MDIKILELLDGAKAAEGLTVVIDVFRAFSVACYVYNNGAEKIIPVGTLDDAYALKKSHPEYILIGERGGKPPEGFDFGNSPTEIKDIYFKNKIVVQTTSAGVQGIVSAKNADEIITGAFVNVDAIIRYIQMKNPRTLSLVCMGHAAKSSGIEDTLCAEYIRDSLNGTPTNFNDVFNKIKSSPVAETFSDDKPWKPLTDLSLCLYPSRFGFVLKVEKDPDGAMYLRKIDVK